MDELTVTYSDGSTQKLELPDGLECDTRKIHQAPLLKKLDESEARVAALEAALRRLLAALNYQSSHYTAKAADEKLEAIAEAERLLPKAREEAKS